MIFNYNTHIIQHYINSPKLKKYKSEHFAEWFPIYQNMPLEGVGDYPIKDSRKTHIGSGTPFFDRTGTIPHYFKFHEGSPLPKLKPMTSTFAEICDNRAKEILSKGERINLLWSGGLDSTNAFFCFDKYKPKDQLKIYLTYNSIVESGGLFDKHIKGKYEYQLDTPAPMQDRTFDDNLFVTGGIGGQLFGLEYKLTSENINKPYQEIVSEKEVNFLEPVFKNFPVPVKTYSEFIWFILFNFKYVGGNREISKGNYIKRLLAFYDTEDFQLWSMLGYEPKFINDDLSTLKWPMRNLIYENSGEKNYAYKRTKNNSNYVLRNNKWLCDIIEDGKFITYEIGKDDMWNV